MKISYETMSVKEIIVWFLHLHQVKLNMRSKLIEVKKYIRRNFQTSKNRYSKNF